MEFDLRYWVPTLDTHSWGVLPAIAHFCTIQFVSSLVLACCFACCSVCLLLSRIDSLIYSCIRHVLPVGRAAMDLPVTVPILQFQLKVVAQCVQQEQLV